MSARVDTRFLKLVVLLNGAVPLAILGWDALHDDLGANGVNYAIRTTGMLTLIFLVLTLAITPLRKLTGWNELIAVRRTLGLYTFFHACLHFSIFFGLDRAFSVDSTIREMVKRVYLLIGTGALVTMVPLAVTSTDGMLRRLGARRWKMLHRAVYAVGAAGVLHYWLLVKADHRKPLAFAIVVGLLFAARPIASLIERRKKRAQALVAPTATKARPRFWSGELRVARVFDETDDIRTFRFVHEKGIALPFDYRAGQYLNLTLSIDDKRVLRSYTIASSPTRPGYCEISVKREPKGVASRWLHEHLVEGASVRVGAPAGKFVFDPGEAKSVVLIAGGVGITPIMAIVRDLTDRSWEGTMHLLYCAKTESDLAFRDELTMLAKRFPNLHLAITLSREDGDMWTGARGRLSRELFLGVGGTLARSPIYLCGPDDMMAATKKLLAELDIPAHQIRTEAFVSAASAATVADVPQASSTGWDPLESTCRHASLSIL